MPSSKLCEPPQTQTSPAPEIYPDAGRTLRSLPVYREAEMLHDLGEVVSPAGGLWRSVSLRELTALIEKGVYGTPLLVYLALRHWARGSFGSKDHRRDTRGLGRRAVVGEVIRAVATIADDIGMSEDAFRAGMASLKSKGLLSAAGRHRWLVQAAEPGGVLKQQRRQRTLRLSLAMIAGLYRLAPGPKSTMAYLLIRFFADGRGLPISKLAAPKLGGLMGTNPSCARRYIHQLTQLGILLSDAGTCRVVPVEILAINGVRWSQQGHTPITGEQGSSVPKSRVCVTLRLPEPPQYLEKVETVPVGTAIDHHPKTLGRPPSPF